MRIVRLIAGAILSIVAALSMITAALCIPLYVGFMVVWLHAPLPQVLFVGASGALVLLGAAWSLNKLGIAVRKQESG
jgi:hypothetical protein